jgi:hypothetical protein
MTIQELGSLGEFIGALLWGPLVSDMYRTPVSEGFRAIRDRTLLEINLEPTTVLGLFGAVIFIRICTAFPYYWLHRVQHDCQAHQR